MTFKEFEDKVDTEVKQDVKKFEGYLRTLEFKMFGGKLHQRVEAPHTGQEPAFAYVPVDSHDGEAPEAGTYPKDDPRWVDPNIPPPGGQAVDTTARQTASTGYITGGDLPQSDHVPAQETPVPGISAGAAIPTQLDPPPAGDPPAELVESGNAQVDPEKAEPVRYSDEGEIPPAAPTKAPQPAAVAALKGNPTKAPKT